MADPDPNTDPAAIPRGADRPDTDALLVASGRVAWLEAVRGVSRSVRHDLANVLTGISFYSSELAAELAEGTAAARAAGAIGDEVARGAQLLDQLLVLWRDPGESQVLPLDPAAVVDALTPLLTAVAAPAELVVGPLDSVVVRASRRALEEALLVLVLDARASGGPIRVGVEAVPAAAAEGEPNARSAAIRVASRGGREPGHAAVDRPASDAEAGNDPVLGLALAAAAARAAGGTVREERRADGTATTIVLLPEAVSRRRRAIDATEGPGVG